MPSFIRSPVAPVRFKRSEPAKSTKWNLALRSSSSVAEGSSDAEASLPCSDWVSKQG